MPTLGESRVRSNFNPNANKDVEYIKKISAACIDWCEQHKDKDPRLAALAQTHFEDAAMWAVKLVTAGT